MSEIKVNKTPIHIRVRVKASARKESIEQLSDMRYAIAVKEPAADNRANTRVLEIIRRLFPRKQVKLVAGHHAPHKTFEVI